MLLTVQDLEAGYDGLPVLFGVNLSIDAGESVAILGANGAGKSTLLKALIGTVAASAGSIWYDGRRITTLPAHRRVTAGIAFSPEGRRVFPNLSAWENLVVGAQGVPTAELTAQAATVYQLFPILEERRRQRASTLSGGEQQMLAIGRALMARPRLILIEEPSQGIAPLVLDQIYAALRALCREGLAVLVVEQYQKFQPGSSDRVLELDKGVLR